MVASTGEKEVELSIVLLLVLLQLEKEILSVWFSSLN